jgi:predicted nucleotidyltransferase
MTQSKKNKILELFLNEPTKQWHFSDIVKSAKISESSASIWLKKLLKDKLIKHIKPKGKMPYFQGNWDHPNYQMQKRIYALSELQSSGLLSRLNSIEKAKTVVLFGSFARSDWNTQSDIDVFVYGDTKDLRFNGVWPKLKREVQVHSYENKKELKQIKDGLLDNVMEGYFIKGSIHDLLEAVA